MRPELVTRTCNYRVARERCSAGVGRVWLVHRFLQDRHNEIQDVLGQTYALPDDVDESDLMDELDALEDDLASEAVGSGATPAYLQVRVKPACSEAARLVLVRQMWTTMQLLSCVRRSV